MPRPKVEILPDVIDSFLEEYEEELSDEAIYCIQEFLNEIHMAFESKVYRRLKKYYKKKEEEAKKRNQWMNENDGWEGHVPFDDEILF